MSTGVSLLPVIGWRSTTASPNTSKGDCGTSPAGDRPTAPGEVAAACNRSSPGGGIVDPSSAAGVSTQELGSASDGSRVRCSTLGGISGATVGGTVGGNCDASVSAEPAACTSPVVSLKVQSASTRLGRPLYKGLAVVGPVPVPGPEILRRCAATTSA
eukprot:1005673-Rhodomonas_salina.4